MSTVSTRRLTIRLLTLALLVSALVSLATEQGSACQNCVRLDPSSAITYGCTTNDCSGSSGCTPTDGGCYLTADMCRMGSDDINDPIVISCDDA